MKDLRSKITIGTVGGSDLCKQMEQLGESGGWWWWMQRWFVVCSSSFLLFPLFPPPSSSFSSFSSLVFDSGFGGAVLVDFDYVFSENGLVAYKKGELVAVQSLRCVCFCYD